MSFTEYFIYEASKAALYAYPAAATASYPLSDPSWTNNRVLATELSPGFYSVTADETKSNIWSIFDGSSIPSSHDASIATLRYVAPVSLIGVGPRTVTATVRLNSTTVTGATVRITKNDGSITRQDVTNSSGQVTFNVTDGTYIVSITYDGATFSGATLVVDGAETPTYNLTALSIPSSDPGKRTVYYTCFDNSGSALANTTVYAKCIKAPGVGLALMGTSRSTTSDNTGLAAFTNCIIGATYEFSMGSGRKINATIPPGTSAIALESIIGQ